MRPKKRIILIDADENRRSILAFTLATHGYLVVTEGPCELVISQWPHVAGLIETAKLHMSPSLLLSAESGQKLLDVPCTHRLANLDPFIVLEAVAMASARKRGPKKQIASFVSLTDAGRKAG